MAKSRKGESDWWSLEAKRMGYPARSVFKLMEISEKFRIFEGASKILDIGASPGSWTMFASAQVLKGKGMVVACDLNPLSIPVEGTNIIQLTGDAFCDRIRSRILSFAPFDVIISDAAPHTTGNRNVDCQKSLDIVQSVFSLSQDALRKQGSFVAKTYQGPDTAKFINLLRNSFGKVCLFKPECSRKSSFECFAIAIRRK